MGNKAFTTVLCLATLCVAQQGFPLGGSRQRTPTRVGNLLLTVSQPGARIYKGHELQAPMSGGPPEPVEIGAFRWFDQRPGGGYAAIAYNAGADGYIPRFAYRARPDQLPPGASQAPLPLPLPLPPRPPPPRPPPPRPPPPRPAPPRSPPPAAPRPFSTTSPPFSSTVSKFARLGNFTPPSGNIQDIAFDGDDEIDDRISSALMASLIAG